MDLEESESIDGLGEKNNVKSTEEELNEELGKGDNDESIDGEELNEVLGQENNNESIDENGNNKNEDVNSKSEDNKKTSQSDKGTQSSGGINVNLSVFGAVSSFKVDLGEKKSGVTDMGLFGDIGGNWAQHMKSFGGCSYPIGKVKVNGSEIGSENVVLSNIDVDMSVWGEASVCNVTFKNNQTLFKKTKLKLDNEFASIKSGAKAEVSLGYKVSKKEKLVEVFKGYVSSIEINVDTRGNQEVSVQITDGKLWMMSSSVTEMKKDKKKYSDAAKMTLQGYSTKFDGTDISISGEQSTESVIYQNGESDYEFIKNISERLGALFYVYCGKLYITSIDAELNHTLNIGIDEGIKNINLSMGLWGIPKKVTVVATNDKDIEKPIKASVTSGDNIGSGKEVTSITSNIGSENEVVIYDNSISSESEAKARAKAYFTRQSIKAVEGRIDAVGNPNVKLGGGLKLSGYDKPIDNSYLITRVKHECDLVDKTFTTSIYFNASKYNPQTASFF